MSYNVKTIVEDCDISLVFVPTEEIARILYKYKNSILRYNPRSYLELENNTVNRDIARAITNRDTNEFALFNNGITMLSEETDFNERVGVKGKGQVVVRNPQIINGGQTAYTLSRVHEAMMKGQYPHDTFRGKEVLLKIITFGRDPKDPGARLSLIEEISKATNSQTQVTDADRRSNDRIQLELQEKLFSDYGYYYERKRGEYADGVKAGYVSRSQIIDRETFLRVCIACDFRPSEARRGAVDRIFRADNFAKTLSDIGRVAEYFFSYSCLLRLREIERSFLSSANNKWGLANYGQALRYGDYAVVAVCNLLCKDQSLDKVAATVDEVLSRWLSFEAFAVSQPTNGAYFRKYIDVETGREQRDLNFTGYYKGRTLESDLRNFYAAHG